MKQTQKSKESKSTIKRAWSFRSLDLLGGSLDFSLNTITGKFQTTIGSLLTILILAFSIGLFVLLYLQFLDTSDPVVTTSTDYSTKPVSMNLFKKMALQPFTFRYRGAYARGEGFHKFITVKGGLPR